MADRISEDLFDTIIFSDDSTVSRGEIEGERKGGKAATINSFTEGLRDGANLASEIGFYSGVCECISNNRAKLEGKYSDRAWSRLDKLTARITQIEYIMEQEGSGFEDILIQIRDEFKLVVSNFKLPISFKKSDVM